MINRFKQIVHHPQATFYLIIVGIILVSPSLFSGFFADDFSQYVLVNEPNILHQSYRPTFYNLFSFFDDNPIKRQEQYSQSLIPWWSSPTFTLNFWRPIAEISHYLDYHYLKNFPILMHLHSLFWYGLLLLLVRNLYQNIFAEKWLVATALLLFVADANHGVTVAWLANRNAIIAAVFAFIAFEKHHLFRQTGSYLSLALSLLALALALFSAEIAVTIGCFYFSYALFIDKNSNVQSLLWLLPALLVFFVWAYLYQHFGFGVAGNKAYYINPFVSPEAFFERFIWRYPTAFAIQFNVLPLHLTNMFKTPLAVLGGFFIVGLLLLAFKKKDKIFNFFLLSLFLSILPITTAAMQERNMIFVGIAAAGVLAKIIAWLFEFSQKINHRKKLYTFCYSLLCIIIFFHVILSSILMLPKSFTPYLFSRESITTALSLPESISEKQVLSFGVPFFDACYLSAIRKVKGESIPERFWNVVTHNKDVSVLRLDNFRLQISNPNGLLQKDDFLVRDIASEPFSVGQQLVLKGVKILISQVDFAGNPTIVEWHFERNLDDKNLLLVYWKNRQLIPFNLINNETRRFP